MYLLYIFLTFQFSSIITLLKFTTVAAQVIRSHVICNYVNKLYNLASTKCIHGGGGGGVFISPLVDRLRHVGITHSSSSSRPYDRSGHLVGIALSHGTIPREVAHETMKRKHARGISSLRARQRKFSTSGSSPRRILLALVLCPSRANVAFPYKGYLVRKQQPGGSRPGPRVAADETCSSVLAFID